MTVLPGGRVRRQAVWTGGSVTVLIAMLLALWAALDPRPAAAQSGYQVRPGDTLRVEVFEDPSLNRDVIVLPDGTVSFPFAGSVAVGGRTLGQVQEAITSGIASNFTSQPNVFVSIPNQPQPLPSGPAVATINVYFLGEFAQPGVQALPRGTTFLQALALGGSFSNFAAQKRVQLRRTDPRTGRASLYTVNYRALANGAQLSQDIVLQDGDVILVPERRLFE